MTRQELYDQIRASSKDEYILAEMKRLGFWKSTDSEPTLSEEIIQREGGLNRELNELVAKDRKYENREAMLAELRKTRMQASKEKQLETKKRNEQKRLEKAEKWQKTKAEKIVYLGSGVSGGLQKDANDVEKLQKYNLPVFENPLHLAQSMEITLGRLRFLSFNREVSSTSHYQRFYIAKKSGGQRLISAPMPMLKKAQYWILNNILEKISLIDEVHGFVLNRSIVSNATPHLEKEVVINLDLKDFFPTVTYKRVKGLFVSLGYSEQIATILGLICTESEVDLVSIDNKKFYVAKGERYLPQGSPASPYITNLICYSLDKRLIGVAKKWGYDYTRYADDMTFSSKDLKHQGQLLWSVRQVIENEGFVIHPDKLKVMRKESCQEVTGIVVNQKLNIDRKTLREFRALLHQIEKTGFANKHWGKGRIENSIVGYANFVSMVNPEKGQKLKEQVNKLLGIVPTTKPEEKVIVENKKEEIKPQIKPIEPSKTDESDKNWWEVL
jgi:RNA-directed DNA polymerase